MQIANKIIADAIPPASKVLVAPLNWGLGHATRCIPLIGLLLARSCQVSIASDGDAFSTFTKRISRNTLVYAPRLPDKLSPPKHGHQHAAEVPEDLVSHPGREKND